MVHQLPRTGPMLREIAAAARQESDGKHSVDLALQGVDGDDITAGFTTPRALRKG